MPFYLFTQYKFLFLKRFFAFIIFISILSSVFISCDKTDTEQTEINNKVFSWRPDLKITDIPDTPVKGFLNGKEIEFTYINFEDWRGSGDNVLNFSNLIPKNSCGFIENDNSFQLMKKAGEIKVGELIKSSFDQNLDGFTAYYEIADSTNPVKSTVEWNCILVITAKNEKTIKGKIAMCFKDDTKSWIAGTFEAIRCYN